MRTLKKFQDEVRFRFGERRLPFARRVREEMLDDVGALLRARPGWTPAELRSEALLDLRSTILDIREAMGRSEMELETQVSVVQFCIDDMFSSAEVDYAYGP